MMELDDDCTTSNTASAFSSDISSYHHPLNKFSQHQCSPLMESSSSLENPDNLFQNKFLRPLKRIRIRTLDPISTISTAAATTTTAPPPTPKHSHTNTLSPWWKTRPKPIYSKTSQSQIDSPCFVCQRTLSQISKSNSALVSALASSRSSQPHPFPNQSKHLTQHSLFSFFPSKSITSIHAHDATSIQSHSISQPLPFKAQSQIPSFQNCFFCEKQTCHECLQTCISCQEQFCQFCSMTYYEYNPSGEVYCLDCSPDGRKMTTQKKEDEDEDDEDIDVCMEED